MLLLTVQHRLINFTQILNSIMHKQFQKLEKMLYLDLIFVHKLNSPGIQRPEVLPDRKKKKTIITLLRKR